MIVFNDSHLLDGGNDAVRKDLSKEAELKNPRSYRKREAANRSCEVHATIYLAKGKRIAIDRELESLLDALAVEGNVEQIGAVFIRVIRTAREGNVQGSSLDNGARKATCNGTTLGSSGGRTTRCKDKTYYVPNMGGNLLYNLSTSPKSP